VYAIDVHAPDASTDVHTFIAEPPAHSAPFVHVVIVPPPLPLLPPLPLPLPDPLLLSQAIRADAAAPVQSPQLAHWNDWPPLILY
jgi:hypothetical protein